MSCDCEVDKNSVRIIGDQLTYQDATDRCHQMNGRLAVVRKKETWKKLSACCSHLNDRYWIGLRRCRNGKYRWVDRDQCVDVSPLLRNSPGLNHQCLAVTVRIKNIPSTTGFPRASLNHCGQDSAATHPFICEVPHDGVPLPEVEISEFGLPENPTPETADGSVKVPDVAQTKPDITPGLVITLLSVLVVVLLAILIVKLCFPKWFETRCRRRRRKGNKRQKDSGKVRFHRAASDESSSASRYNGDLPTLPLQPPDGEPLYVEPEEPLYFSIIDQPYTAAEDPPSQETRNSRRETISSVKTTDEQGYEVPLMWSTRGRRESTSSSQEGDERPYINEEMQYMNCRRQGRVG